VQSISGALDSQRHQYHINRLFTRSYFVSLGASSLPA